MFLFCFCPRSVKSLLSDLQKCIFFPLPSHFAGQKSDSFLHHALSTQEAETELLGTDVDEEHGDEGSLKGSVSLPTATLPPRRGMQFARDVVTTLFHPRHVPFWLAMFIAVRLENLLSLSFLSTKWHITLTLPFSQGAGFGTMSAFVNILIKHLVSQERRC